MEAKKTVYYYFFFYCLFLNKHYYRLSVIRYFQTFCLYIIDSVFLKKKIRYTKHFFPFFFFYQGNELDAAVSFSFRFNTSTEFQSRPHQVISFFNFFLLRFFNFPYPSLFFSYFFSIHLNRTQTRFSFLTRAFSRIGSVQFIRRNPILSIRAYTYEHITKEED